MAASPCSLITSAARRGTEPCLARAAESDAAQNIARTGSGEVTGAFAFSAKSRCLNVAYFANCGGDLFDGLSGRRSFPSRTTYSVCSCRNCHRPRPPSRSTAMSRFRCYQPGPPKSILCSKCYAFFIMSARVGVAAVSLVDSEKCDAMWHWHDIKCSPVGRQRDTKETACGCAQSRRHRFGARQRCRCALCQTTSLDLFAAPHRT